jgi:hypothetical protein
MLTGNLKWWGHSVVWGVRGIVGGEDGGGDGEKTSTSHACHMH